MNSVIPTSGIIPWIAAEAEDKPNIEGANFDFHIASGRSSGFEESGFSIEDLSIHQFPAKRVDAVEAVLEVTRGEIETLETEAVADLPLDNPMEDLFEDPLDRDPDLWLYRKRTIALLRKYLRYSLETGRLPSILGSEFFRSHVTSYSVTTFEDRVVFVHDVEVCLQRLDEFARKIIGCVVLQEHHYDSAARRLHCSRRTIERGLFTALDELSEQFLAVGMLVRVASRADLCRESELEDEDEL
jgi:hypothetical protein